MSEQKYYVKLKLNAYIDNTDFLGHANYYEGHIWLDVDSYFVTKRERDSFTKTKLAEIMDGALYKFCEDSDNCLIGRMDCKGEWINPIIELVPVEEE